ncbi:MAG: UDP-N-acetylglucosamine 1-carboxyvinyltransferase [Ruminococcaceae bacterium]|nr:UDP-N-acetylglucosamine 1-carboxyvinyltransferase [Oscillospiraceae bacterium]
MASYLIRGGRRLVGDVTVSGSKNAALGIIAAAMILDGSCRIENIPEVLDIEVLLQICESLGAVVRREKDGSLFIDPTTTNTWEVTHEKVRAIRGSYYLLGAMLARYKHASIYMPGGCNFGPRPIDQHMKGFEALGAEVTIEYGKIQLHAPEFKGEHIFLDVVSVGATINIMIAAAKAEGVTVIENAAREPHIVDVANFLNTMGANIKGAGTDVIRITGVQTIPARSCYSIIPDQIEAGTYMIAAALTHGDITVHNIIPKHMEPLSAKLEEMGAAVEPDGDSLRVFLAPEDELKAANFKTLPYPGFPTDLQPQTTVMLCTAQGSSKMAENVWESRFQFVDDLKMMGADITIAGHVAIIAGGTKLTGATVTARDLRAGAAMVLAGLAAEGETRVLDVAKVERGYERFSDKLRMLGADISREDE